MTRTFAGCSAAALLTLSVHPAWSLTAEQAWATWQSISQQMGQTIAAEAEERSPGGLTVRGVVFQIADEEATIGGRIAEIVFTEQSDGTVSIAMSDSYQMTVVAEEAGESAEIVMDIGLPGMTMTARDAEAGRVAYAFAAPSLSVTVSEMLVEGEAVPFEMAVVLSDADGTYVGGGDGDALTQSFNAAAADVDLSIRDPEGEGKFTMAMDMADIVSSGTGSGLQMLSSGDVLAVLRAGFATEGEATFGATTFTMDFTEGSDRLSAAGAFTGGTAKVGVADSALDIDQTYRGFTLTMSGSEIPFPQISASMGELTTDFAIPLAQSDAAQPFSLRTVFGDLIVGEELWSMIDPAGAIPRDPATAVVDLSGALRLLVDLLDEPAMESTAEPAQIEALTINQVLLRLAGAELTAAGAFTFDNGDRTTFDGMPAPDGTVNLTLTGGNALLDTLVRMGLVQEDQAMMGRMMAGMLARPGAGPDELVSEITVRPDGTVLANGAALPF